MAATQRSARQVADELRAAVLAERRAQAAKLALVCELADTYRSVLPVLDLPGGPQLVSAGGDGTPEIDEFLVQEIHPLLGVGPAAAWSLLRQATNLRDRHPKVWALVQEGVVPAWQGRQVAELCQALPSDAAGYVDEQVALPLTHLPWPRVRRRLMGLIVAADTELAAEQAARARRGRFVRIKHNDDGTSWLLALLTTAEAVRLDETITTIARSICDDPDYVGGPDEARADALGVLVTPSKAGQSAVVGSAPATLVVHLDHTAVSQSPDSLGVVGRVEGPGGLDNIGPVLLNQVCELLAHRRVRVLPVIDLADQISAGRLRNPRPAPHPSAATRRLLGVPLRHHTRQSLRPRPHQPLAPRRPTRPNQNIEPGSAGPPTPPSQNLRRLATQTTPIRGLRLDLTTRLPLPRRPPRHHLAQRPQPNQHPQPPNGRLTGSFEGPSQYSSRRVRFRLLSSEDP